MDWLKAITTLPKSGYDWKPEHEAQAVAFLQDAARSLDDLEGGANWFFNEYPKGCEGASAATKSLLQSIAEVREQVRNYRGSRESLGTFPNNQEDCVKRYAYQQLFAINQYCEENQNKALDYVFSFGISNRNYYWGEEKPPIRERLALNWKSTESGRTGDFFLSSGIMELIRRDGLLRRMAVQGRVQTTLIVEAEKLETKDPWDLFRVKVLNSRGASVNLKYLAMPPEHHGEKWRWFSNNKRKHFVKFWEDYSVSRVSTALGI